MGKNVHKVTIVYVVETQAEAEKILDEVVGVCGPYEKADIRNDYVY